MPIKGTQKEKRQYEKIKRSAKKSGRYKGHAKEVAARTVMKQRSRKKGTGRKKGTCRKKGGSRKSR